MPGVKSKMVFPKTLPCWLEAVLLRDYDLGYRLPWIFLRIPYFTCILNRLIFQILKELKLQVIFGIVLRVELA
jgi:hypothetical protein